MFELQSLLNYFAQQTVSRWGTDLIDTPLSAQMNLCYGLVVFAGETIWFRNFWVCFICCFRFFFSFFFWQWSWSTALEKEPPIRPSCFSPSRLEDIELSSNIKICEVYLRKIIFKSFIYFNMFAFVSAPRCKHTGSVSFECTWIVGQLNISNLMHFYHTTCSIQSVKTTGSGPRQQ